MKKVLLTSLFLPLLSSSVFASGYSLFSDSCLVPYTGADAAMRYAPFQRSFGDNVFKKYYPEGNVFVGVKFSDYLGVELGYKTSVTKTRVTSLGAGDVAVGIPVADPPAVHRATASFKGWHAELVGLFPVYKKDCISLLGSIGFSRTKLFARDKLVQDNFGINPPTAYSDNSFVTTFSKTKTLLIASMGAQFALDENTYCRAKINWENTKKLKSIAAQENSAAILKLKNSFVYSVGIVFNFL